MKKLITIFLITPIRLIGYLLIGLAKLINLLRYTLLFIITISIIMGVLFLTVSSLFQLIVDLFPSSDYQLPPILIEKPIWNVVVVIIGGATMWLGISKTFENDKEFK